MLFIYIVLFSSYIQPYCSIQQSSLGIIRAAAVQGLHVLQQIADDDSGDDNDNQNYEERCSVDAEQDSERDTWLHKANVPYTEDKWTWTQKEVEDKK